MDDLISRQAAINAADKIIERDTSGSNAVVNAMIAWSEYIRTLPSAQPETHDKRTETHACDLIDRQAAIGAINSYFGFNVEEEYGSAVQEVINGLPSTQPGPEEFEWCHDCKEYDQNSHCCHRWTKVIRQTVKELKEAQPERKKGRWIPVMNGRGGHCCDRCNRYAPSYANGNEHLSDFCPNCGARMEAEG